MSRPQSPDAFTIERHGEVIAILTSPILEMMEPSLLDDASALLLDALGRETAPQIVVDLTPLTHFGSSFLALLIRCWKLANARDGAMVLSGVSDHVKDLLHITSLDMVWPMYGNLREAIEALQSD
jgi:anti-sigma B factor antagonist